MNARILTLILCALMVGTNAQAQRSRLPPIPLRMSFERGADGGVSTLNVEIRNVEGSVLCVSADYAGPARVVMTHEPAIEVTAEGAAASAQAGCVELASGTTLNVSYDVRSLFPGQDFAEPRLCYSLPLRPGASSEGDAALHQLWSACSRARR